MRAQPSRRTSLAGVALNAVTLCLTYFVGWVKRSVTHRSVWWVTLRFTHPDMAGPVKRFFVWLVFHVGLSQNRGWVTSDAATVDQSDIRGLDTAGTNPVRGRPLFYIASVTKSSLRGSRVGQGFPFLSLATSPHSFLKTENFVSRRHAREPR